MAVSMLMYASNKYKGRGQTKDPAKPPGPSSLLKPAILIVSDTAAVHALSDHTGPVLSKLFTGITTPAGEQIWDEPVVEIVPDLVAKIQLQIKKLTEDKRFNLIVTSGGTGFAARDRTPEAVLPLLTKQAPGLVHAMLSASLEVTPFAMMSRPVAGIRGKAIIVTLPGSSKGAKENLEAIIRFLPHACMQAAGENSREAHAEGVEKLELDVGVTPPDDDEGRTPSSSRPESPTLLVPPERRGSGGKGRPHRWSLSSLHSPSHARSSSRPRSQSRYYASPSSPNPSPPASPSHAHARRHSSAYPPRHEGVTPDDRSESTLLPTDQRPVDYGSHGHGGGCAQAHSHGQNRGGGHRHGHHGHHGHGHGHGHGHKPPKPHTTPSERPQPRSNDPSAGATGRSRTSPYPMLSVDEALDVISTNTPAPQLIELPVTYDLVGYRLARDVHAYESVPAFRASIVDGYAIIAPESAAGDADRGIPSTKGDFPVMSISHAKACGQTSISPGEIVRVTTGAPIPDGANAVVMVEDTALVSSTPDGKEEAIVSILTDQVRPGENIREPGSDVMQSTLILEQGDVVTEQGGEIGLLASTGVKTVQVYAKPVVGVLSTGDEVVDLHQPSDTVALANGQIRDSNRPSLLSCLRAWGYPVVDLGIARDTPHTELEESLRSALRGTPSTPGVDVIITTGGVSMGELDLLKPTIERRLGGTIHFGRVAMKPGKPTTFATIPFKPTSEYGGGRENRLLFGLPGNPASALVTLNLFVLPCLHQMTGHSPPYGLPRLNVRLAEDIKPDPKRTEYHRAHIFVSRDGRLAAKSTGGQRSSRVGSMKHANGLLVIEPGEHWVEKGHTVEALLMGNLGSE